MQPRHAQKHTTMNVQKHIGYFQIYFSTTTHFKLNKMTVPQLQFKREAHVLNELTVSYWCVMPVSQQMRNHILLQHSC